MRERRVVIVAFAGVQPLDAVGPFEVFAGATRAAGRPGRSGRVRGRRRLGRAVAPSGPRAGWSWARSRCPTRPSASTPWCWPAATGANAAARRRGARDVDRRHRPALPAGGHRVHGRLPRPPRPGCSTGGGSPPTGPAPRELAAEYPGARRRPRPDLHPRRQVLDQRRRHGRHRPVPGPRAGRPRGGGGPDGGPLAGHVPAPTGRPDPVRLAGLGAPGRALDGPGGADPGRGRARAATTASRPWPPPPP